MSIVNRMAIETGQDVQSIARLRTTFAKQKQAQIRDPYPSYEERVEGMNTVVALLLGHREEIRAALNADFGSHAASMGEMIEVLGMVGRADYNIRHLASWMAAEEREIDPAVWGSASASVRPQPKGVIGNMVPWNFPFDIAFGPLLDMLAAGNRVILKPSDLAPPAEI